jgi:hypothetical protein
LVARAEGQVQSPRTRTRRMPDAARGAKAGQANNLGLPDVVAELVVWPVR